MKITKAIITAAGPDQRKLPLQTLIDRDRKQRTVLEILINEIRTAGIDEIGIAIQPEYEKNFEQVLEHNSYSSVRFIHQNQKLAKGEALKKNQYGQYLLRRVKAYSAIKLRTVNNSSQEMLYL